MTNATSDFTLFKAAHAENNRIELSYTITGGSIKAASADSFKIYDLGNSNASIRWEKGKDSLYTTLTLPNTADKIMLWKGIKDMYPICEPKEL